MKRSEDWQAAEAAARITESQFAEARSAAAHASGACSLATGTSLFSEGRGRQFIFNIKYIYAEPYRTLARRFASI